MAIRSKSNSRGSRFLVPLYCMMDRKICCESRYSQKSSDELELTKKERLILVLQWLKSLAYIEKHPASIPVLSSMQSRTPKAKLPSPEFDQRTWTSENIKNQSK